MKATKRFIIVSVMIVVLSSCNAVVRVPTQTPVPTATKFHTLMPVATYRLTSPTLIVIPQLTPTPACADAEISSPMTKQQLQYLQNRRYRFLYAANEKNIHNIYSLNRADTLCTPGYPTGTFQIWKVVSGFIVDLRQPSKDLYNPGGEHASNIYVKARFISQDGNEHDYWLQLTGIPPNNWFELVQWDKPILESKNQPGLTAMSVLEESGHVSTENLNLKTMIPNGLLRVNDQFVAILSMGYTSENTLTQFINAFEGKADYPIAPEAFSFITQALIVPSKP